MYNFHLWLIIAVCIQIPEVRWFVLGHYIFMSSKYLYAHPLNVWSKQNDFQLPVNWAYFEFENAYRGEKKHPGKWQGSVHVHLPKDLLEQSWEHEV